MFGVIVIDSSFADDEFNALAFFKGSLTLGDRQNNFTIGLGVATGLTSNGADGPEREYYPFILSGMKQISQKVSFVSENWIVRDGVDLGGFSLLV